MSNQSSLLTNFLEPIHSLKVGEFKKTKLSILKEITKDIELNNSEEKFIRNHRPNAESCTISWLIYKQLPGSEFGAYKIFMPDSRLTNSDDVYIFRCRKYLRQLWLRPQDNPHDFIELTDGSYIPFEHLKLYSKEVVLNIPSNIPLCDRCKLTGLYEQITWRCEDKEPKFTTEDIPIDPTPPGMAEQTIRYCDCIEGVKKSHRGKVRYHY